MSEQITSLPSKMSEPEGTGTSDGATLAGTDGVTLAGADGATLATLAGAVLAGGWVGAVVALPEQAETVIARTAIAAPAVRKERIGELLQGGTLVVVRARRPGKASTVPARGSSVAPCRCAAHPALRLVAGSALPWIKAAPVVEAVGPWGCEGS